MSGLTVDLPSGRTLLALLPLAVLLLSLVMYCLVDLARAPAAPYLPKWGWAPLIVLVIPWGSILYLALRRVHRPPPGEVVPPAPAAPSATAPPTAVVASAVPPIRDPGRPVVVTHHLTRDYGNASGLFDVDLVVPDGCVYGLVGPNGAGKTTLLSILTGTRHADRGTVRIDAPPHSVAVCPDVPEFEPWLTAFEVVDLARHYVAPHLGSDTVWSALRTTGLTEVADRRVSGFSRGMTQRLGLAAAIVGQPRLLLLDEPTSALDPAGRAEMLDLVAAMRGRRTVIFSSHILADVQRVADQVGVLRAGRLLYQGATRALVEEHLHPSWWLRLNSSADEVVTRLRTRSWIRRADAVDEHTVRVDAESMESGEAGIPETLASCHARLVSCEPLAADLETAFLALTTKEGTS